MAHITEELKRVIRGLFEDKQALKELDDSVKKSSDNLKQWMNEHNESRLEVDNIVVTYSPQVRSSMDETATIAILKELAESVRNQEDRDRILSCIRTREYVDDTALEQAIYDGLVQKDDLEPAVITKTVQVLRLAQSRKKS